VRGWQRRPYRGYRYSGSRFNGGVGRGSGDQGTGQNASHVHGARPTVQIQIPAGGETSHRGASDSQGQVDFRAQKTWRAEAVPQVPEVFKNEKAGKAKVDEGRSSEGGRADVGDDKPFCFRCYKPGHGKLVCTTKLRCDICGNNEHMTGRWVDVLSLNNLVCWHTLVAMM
jgi:hypothetical protein